MEETQTTVQRKKHVRRVLAVKVTSSTITFSTRGCTHIVQKHSQHDQFSGAISSSTMACSAFAKSPNRAGSGLSLEPTPTGALTEGHCCVIAVEQHIGFNSRVRIIIEDAQCTISSADSVLATIDAAVVMRQTIMNCRGQNRPTSETHQALPFRVKTPGQLCQSSDT